VAGPKNHQPIDPAVGGPTAAALTGLRSFLARAVGDGTTVDIAAPAWSAGTDSERARLYLWPLSLLADQSTRGGDAPFRLRLRARYAVLAGGPVETAVALVDRVLTALAGEPRYQLVLEPVPSTLWGSSGIPRPAVLIDVPVQVAVAAPTAPRVTRELQVGVAGMRSIVGRVLGPGGVALPGMTVTAAGTGNSVVTDTSGGFALPGQPAGSPVPLHLSGRGLHLRVEVVPEATDPVVIHCPIEEV
jgi:hypothetical protein